MRKDIILGAILLAFIVFIINVIVQNTQTMTTPVPAPVVETQEEADETMEEKMKRWDRGEFTEEEIAEIKDEEAREDKAVADLLENQ